MTYTEFKDAWYAGYLRGLAATDRVPPDVVDGWIHQDFGDRCKACGRDRMDPCGACSDGVREQMESIREYDDE